MIKPGLWVAMVVAAVIIQVPASAAQEIINVPTEDRVLEPSVTELFRVGSMAGEEWETFADVRGVAFDGAGNLYVLDAENHRVVVTDGSGRLLRQFGKEGDGPGEFRFASGMVVAPDGTVAVLDLGHQAFVIYDADSGGIWSERARCLRGDGRIRCRVCCGKAVSRNWPRLRQPVRSLTRSYVYSVRTTAVETVPRGSPGRMN